MKSLKKSEKSKGVILFALNTPDTNFEEIAQRNSKLIEHHLNLPVTIITEKELPVISFNNRISIDTGMLSTWRNTSRYKAYELSPYDKTLLLDCDYIIFDDQLLKLFDLNADYLLTKSVSNVFNSEIDSMGVYSIPMKWATVVMFNKCSRSKMLFDMVGRIERNYAYYKKLYNIRYSNFRNDFAFTIADNIINGYKQDLSNYIPWPLTTVEKKISKIDYINDNLVIRTPSEVRIIPKQSVHIMSKEYLLSDEFNNLTEQIINE